MKFPPNAWLTMEVASRRWGAAPRTSKIQRAEYLLADDVSKNRLHLEGRIRQLEADLKSAAKSDPMTATEIPLRREIGQLEKELAKLGRDYDECRGEFDKAATELAAEKALADQAANLIKGDAVGIEWKRGCTKFLAAYRKARGL